MENYCRDCGKELKPEAAFCSECGAAIPVHAAERSWCQTWWAIALFVVVALFVGNALFNSRAPAPVSQEPIRSESPTEMTESVPETPSAPAAAPTPPAPKQWVEVKSWSGSGIKQTEPFTITSSSWRINHTNSGGGLLQISVKSPGSEALVALAANRQEAGADTSYVYESGTFYLQVNSANTRWTVKVEEER